MTAPTGLRRLLLVAVLLSALAASTWRTAMNPNADPALDHIILATSSLEAAIPEFTRLSGVTPVRGGQPATGASNALVSLDDGRYLEILTFGVGTVDTSSTASAPRPRFTPVAWAAHTNDMSRLTARLRASGFDLSDPAPGSRRRPDGTLLKWTTARLKGDGLALAPFFIQWDSMAAHPSTTSPAGCRLIELILTDPAPDRLGRLRGLLGLAATVRQGQASAMTVRLHCPTGDLTFGG